MLGVQRVDRHCQTSSVKALAMELRNIWHFLEIIINLDVPGAIRSLGCCWIQEPHVAEGWYLL